MQTGMFIDGITVGHASDVVTDRALQSGYRDALLYMGGQGQRFNVEGVEQVIDDMFRFNLHPNYTVVPV